MEYTNLVSLKSRLNITDNTNNTNTLLSRYITSTSKSFDLYLGRNLWVTTYRSTQEVHSDSIVLNYPINQITSIKLWSSSGDTIEYDYLEWAIIYLWYELNDKVYIEYTSWYELSAIPDVEDACTSYISFLYEKDILKSEKNIKSESLSAVGDISRSYSLDGEAEKTEIAKWKACLDAYILPYCWAI